MKQCRHQNWHGQRRLPGPCLSRTRVTVGQARSMYWARAALRSPRLTGLPSILLIPSPRHRSSTSGENSAVSPTTGMARASSCFMIRVASKPSMIGMRRSMSTRSNVEGLRSMIEALTLSTPSCPLTAISLVQPMALRKDAHTFWQMVLSSTTSTCGFFEASMPTVGLLALGAPPLPLFPPGAAASTAIESSMSPTMWRSVTALWPSVVSPTSTQRWS
mmetsp:Transcript_6750/g.23568  ORF Transcript_6750/g.23568 Transcript_6750/m.23568 type:complete len:218 (-) Transcript_6750:725-1378(-)